MQLESLIDVSTGGQTVPMSKEDTESFLTMGMLDMKQPDLVETYKEDWPQAIKIMWKRLEWAGFGNKVSFPVQMFICCLCNNPAKVVMWAYTLAHMLEKDKTLAKVTMETLTKYFPDGFPQDEVYEACWISQKGKPRGVDEDNLMDIKEWWQ